MPAAGDQRDAQFFSMYLFIFLTLYMFRAHRADHQERQIVSILPLVAVTLCREVHFRSATRHGHQQLPDVVLTQFVSPDDEHDVLETGRDLKT